MAKKKKGKATKAAIESVRLKPIDVRQKSLDNFIQLWKNKRMWLSFGYHCFIRVKVLEATESNHYENILVKILEKPKWISEAIGTFINTNRTGLESKNIKVGTKILVNYLSLYNSEMAMKYLEKSELEKQSNLIAVRSRLKIVKREVEQIIIIKENINKRLLNK